MWVRGHPVRYWGAERVDTGSGRSVAVSDDRLGTTVYVIGAT